MNSNKKRTRILRLFDDSDLDQDIGKCITEIIGNEISKFDRDLCDRLWAIQRKL